VKISAKEAIRNRLKGASTPLAIHEFLLQGYSENAIGSRLPEMALAGEVVGTKRHGTSYKEWRLVEKSPCDIASTVQKVEVKFDGNQAVMFG